MPISRLAELARSVGPVQSRQLTAKLSIAVLASVRHYGAGVKRRDQEQTVDLAAAPDSNFTDHDGRQIQ